MSILFIFNMSQATFSAMNSGADVNNREKTNQNTVQTQSQKQIKKRVQKNWPPTFYPSEKINADSSVSFPVDI